MSVFGKGYRSWFRLHFQVSLCTKVFLPAVLASVSKLTKSSRVSVKVWDPEESSTTFKHFGVLVLRTFLLFSSVRIFFVQSRGNGLVFFQWGSANQTNAGISRQKLEWNKFWFRLLSAGIGWALTQFSGLWRESLWGRLGKHSTQKLSESFQLAKLPKESSPKTLIWSIRILTFWGSQILSFLRWTGPFFWWKYHELLILCDGTYFFGKFGDQRCYSINKKS